MNQFQIRQYFTLLHLPTTSSLLALIIVGASLVPVLQLGRLAWLLAEGFLMIGVASNYFDEITGRPWRTTIPERNLWSIGLISYILSSVIGLHLSTLVGSWFLAFVVAWGILVPAYSLELFGGKLHNAWTIAFNASLSTLAGTLIQVPSLTFLSLSVSASCGAIAFHGRQHYEAGKLAGKDRTDEPTAWVFWRWMRLEIVVIDTIAAFMIMVKVLS